MCIVYISIYLGVTYNIYIYIYIYIIYIPNLTIEDDFVHFRSAMKENTGCPTKYSTGIPVVKSFFLDLQILNYFYFCEKCQT